MSETPKVVNIQRQKASSVIAILEEALERAKSGELQGVAIVEVLTRDGQTIHTDFSGNWLDLLGAVGRLQYELMVNPDD